MDSLEEDVDFGKFTVVKTNTLLFYLFKWKSQQPTEKLVDFYQIKIHNQLKILW